MKILIPLVSLLTIITTSAEKQRKVYICKGAMSKRYHISPKCKGLKKCSTKIHEVSLSEAKSIGRTLCKYED